MIYVLHSRKTAKSAHSDVIVGRSNDLAVQIGAGDLPDSPAPPRSPEVGEHGPSKR
jgi:hypothetical protein